MTEALFTPSEGGYLPSVYARSPWSLQLIHGGPVAALLAHHVEQLVPDERLRIARLTTDLFRPVPFAPLTVDTEIVRKGRRIMAVRASLASDGVEVSRAQALLLRAADVDASSGDLLADPVPFPDSAEGPLDQRRGEPSYSGTVRFRYVTPRGSAAPVVAWIRVPLLLLPGVGLSPAVHAAAISDYVSPLSNMHRSRGWGVPFINADITLYLFRQPVGEWLCLATTGRGSHEGIAVGEAVLHDKLGPAGRCVAAALAQPAPPPGIAEG
ncbi:MAG: thioesterase family protein [Myxococcota bacterium]